MSETSAELPDVTFEPVIDGMTVDLTPMATNDDQIIGWHWDFGDNMGVTTRNARHIYNVPGTYTVVLTVYGNDGSTVLSSDVTVPAVAVEA